MKILLSFIHPVPSQPPQRFTISKTSLNTIEVQWSPVSPRSIHGVLSGYRVYYNMKSPFHSSAGKNVNVNASVTSVKITSLDSNAEYVVKVAALTKKGAGPYSDELKAKTTEDGKRMKLFVTVRGLFTLQSKVKIILP